MAGCMAVSFDVWGTLVDLDKTLDHLSEVASRRLGLTGEEARRAVYGSHDDARRLRRLTPNLHPAELISRAKEMLAARLSTETRVVDSILFEAFTTVKPEAILYPDVEPALSELEEAGCYMGVIGNVLFWPSSYTVTVLERIGLSRYFKTLVFSDTVGYSKPDRGIFLEFAEASGFEPGRIIHVGDNTLEDVGGALSSGFIGVLINRRTRRNMYIEELKAAVINDMRELPKLYHEISRTTCT
ncbi:HAD family hydrolase [Desulfurococcus mucosus]|uniref:Haloacid dehalogenase domain protein hydrolase n=1 Tax=Desulfurococcus mucosus (strain ATCC 35584 / DSM 2162 / JCM 9187 / O7/1) TaxID=765177 RepID=E8RA26_DESM0|nr:HAD family hydrolase [Desulfurococcus mucosus]ADV65352.1 Haloacid dehalogenase domain protein hydrolase [Desulfurococcus mucosus DSM 2162]